MAPDGRASMRQQEQNNNKLETKRVDKRAPFYGPIVRLCEVHAKNMQNT